MTSAIARSLQDVELLGTSQILRDEKNTWFISSAHNTDSLKETVTWLNGTVQR